MKIISSHIKMHGWNSTSQTLGDISIKKSLLATWGRTARSGREKVIDIPWALVSETREFLLCRRHVLMRSWFLHWSPSLQHCIFLNYSHIGTAVAGIVMLWRMQRKSEQQLLIVTWDGKYDNQSRRSQGEIGSSGDSVLFKIYLFGFINK